MQRMFQFTKRIDEQIAPKSSSRTRLPAGEVSSPAAPSFGVESGDVVQKLSEGEPADSADSIHAAAHVGTQGSSGKLPFLDAIQRSFGRHDVSQVQSHSDGFARQGTQMMFARAFARGNHVAFGQTPSLHETAHEAAHIVQQRSQLSLRGGVGGLHDTHEQHAEQVADAVVQGRSSEALLSKYVSPNTTARAGSQGQVQGYWGEQWLKEKGRQRAIRNQAPREPKTDVNWKHPTQPETGPESKSIAMWNPAPGLKTKVKQAEGPSLNDPKWLLELFEGRTLLGTVEITYDSTTRELHPDSLQVNGVKGQGYGAMLAKEAIKAMSLPQLRARTTNARTIKLNCVNPLSAHISCKELNLKWTAGQDTRAQNVSAAAQRAEAELVRGAPHLVTNGKTRGGYDITKFREMWARIANLAQNHGVRVECEDGTYDGTVDYLDFYQAFGLLMYIADKGRTRGGGAFAINIFSPVPP
jgi:hypothetical protein